ncbi:MAG: TIGR03016 family PEP-CTERM system-associated outer membrane protein [Congregibacter sp.]
MLRARPSFGFCGPTALAAVLAALAVPVSSAEWTQRASVGVGSYYTDNVCLAPDDQEGKLVGTFTPNLALRGEGGRARMALRGAIEYNTLGDSDLNCQNRGFGGNLRNREPWVPRINFVASVDAIDKWFVLEADAAASQNPVNPFAAGGDENLNALGNTNITYQWGAGARLQRSYEDAWSVLLRYNYSEQYNTANVGIGDNTQDLITLDAGMLPQSSRLSFRVGGVYREVDIAEQRGLPAFTNRLSRLELRSFFAVSSSWVLNATIGEEDNVFTSQSDEIDGGYWDAGIRWAPNPRIVVGLGYGERFFGEAPRFDMTYRHKRSRFTASYARDVQFPRNLRAGDSDFDPVDPLEPGVGELPGDGIVNPNTPTFVGNAPVLTERFNLRYTFAARRTTMTISGTESLQRRVSDGRDGEFRIALASISRRLSRASSVYARVRWQENQAQGGAIDGEFAQGLETWQYTAGLSRRLSPNTVVGLQYRYTDQTSRQNANSFVEQRIGATFNYIF